MARKPTLDFAFPLASTKAFNVDITSPFAVKPNVLRRLLKSSF
jgi:hypothetical protein